MKVFVKRTFTKKFFLTFIILSLILIGYTKDKEITKFYNMMVADILKVTLDIDDKKKKRGR